MIRECKNPVCRFRYPVDNLEEDSVFCPKCGEKTLIVEKMPFDSHYERSIEDNSSIRLILILDNLRSAYNVGSIIRTSEIVGVHGIIIPKRRSVGLTSVVAKTSAGAIEYIPVARVSNISMAIDELKEKGLWIYGADMSGENNYFDQDMKGPIGLVVGAEGKGMSRLVKEKCDFLVKIPMKGIIQSLNASVSAGVLMYEVVRQRQA